MNITKETLDLVNKSFGQPFDASLTKAGINVGTGLVGYSLEAPSKLLYPDLTPLRNIIPRVGSVTGYTGTAENWKAIIGINTTQIRAGVSEGNRGGVISYNVVNRVMAYSGLGLEDTVTWEAEYAAQGFEDARATAALTLLQATMLQEEPIILNGNATLTLGTTPTPTLVPSTTGGTIAAATTNFVYCVALTQWGLNGSGGPQNPVPTTGVLVPVITRGNADGTSDVFGGGMARISAASAAATTTGATSSIAATVTAVQGAFGYAWFFGVTAGAGNAFLAAITVLPTVVITAASTSTYAANSASLSSDNSVNPLEFDGLITQCIKTGGYYKSLQGGTLTADGKGSVNEIDAVFKYFWDAYKLSPSTIWCDSQTIRDITSKVAQGTNPSFRINLQNTAESLGNMVGGQLVTSLLNKYALNGAQVVAIKLHPNMPTGTIYFDLDKNPYPTSKVPVPRRIRTRQEYYQIQWPLRTRKDEFGVYVDEMLQVYMPFGTGVITDIAPG